MKKEHSFLEQIPKLSEIHDVMDKNKRFGTYNEKTLGFEVVGCCIF